MSIINKMLRDLDQRQAALGAPPGSTHGRVVHGATVSLAPALGGARAVRSGMLVGLAVLLLAMVAGLAWWAWTSPVAATRTQPIAAPAAAAAPAPPQASTAPVSGAPVASVAAMQPVPTKPTLPATDQVRVKTAVAAVSAAPSATTAAQNSGLLASSTADTLPPPAGTPALSAATNPDPQAAPLRQAQAGREALAQAQALWNAGSHDAATDLLQQALALAHASPGAPNGLVLASLARELARMELADGRAAAALEMLTRLEPVLGRDADVWALRANAAQRLARHQDSVQAYAMALQLRPNTQRWLLGSAVSLAALGQAAQAGDMASKARSLGPISPEVLTYLRQAGVPLTEP